jgi:hypothetical protein
MRRFSVPTLARLRRRSFGSALVAFAAAVFFACPAASLADETGPPFRVVVHPRNPTTAVERQFLANCFLKEVTRWGDGEALRPVDLKPGNSVRKRFSETVLKRSVTAVKSFWQQRIFSGRGVPPPELESDDAVVAYVKEHRGGVGYVSPAADVSMVKVLRIE